MAIKVDRVPRWDLEPWRGIDHQINVTMEQNGSIAGWTFAFAIRNTRDEADATDVVADQDTSGVTIAIIDAGSSTTPGVFRITIAKAILTSLTNRKVYWWGCKRNDSGSNTPIVHGTYTPINSGPR